MRNLTTDHIRPLGHRALVAAAALTLCLGLAACGSQQPTGGASSGDNADKPAAAQPANSDTNAADDATQQAGEPGAFISDEQCLSCHGGSYEALAEKLGIDPATFAATMETWNKAVADQKDDAFGRLSFASALDTAPYYAIKVSPGIHHTMGGVKINTNAEVLTAEDQVIPGLYAAGEVTGGVHGANRLGGNAVADIVIFGRIAAQNAAAYIAK